MPGRTYLNNARGLVAAAMSGKHNSDTPAARNTTMTPRRKHNEVEVIDLSDDDGPESQHPANKRIKPSNTSERVTSRQFTTPLRTKPRADSLAANTLPSPSSPLTFQPPPTARTARTVTPVRSTDNSVLPTPNSIEEKKALYKLPELADRYVPRVSSAEGIDYTNPQKFTLKPPFWKSWTGKEYTKFAEHLRWQFDPSDSAWETGKPIEEIKHVFTSLVCNPLYDAEEASRRGEEGMQEIIALHKKGGTPMRPWGLMSEPGKRFIAEFWTVTIGTVHLITPNGSKAKLKLEQLPRCDVEYLESILSPEDLAVLYKTQQASRNVQQAGNNDHSGRVQQFEEIEESGMVKLRKEIEQSSQVEKSNEVEQSSQVEKPNEVEEAENLEQPGMEEMMKMLVDDSISQLD